MNNGERKGKKFTWQMACMLLLVVLATVVVFAFYRVMLRFPYFQYVMYGYMIAAAALILTYVIYNRGFSRKGVTVDMLPAEWSEAEKESYIEDGKRRMRRSRWMLIPIIAFVFTFGYEAIELYVIPFIQEMLSK
ncbi:MAG: hypothetical protein IJW44_03275 [Clostridia bacterium]|nr:hypothetical protein [Clostridia bacterium]